MLTTTLTPLGGKAYAHPDLDPKLHPIDAVTPHPENPRNGDIDAIIDSILENGLYAGVVAQTSTRRIIVGNHRYAALMELGAERIPVTWADVDDALAIRILLADNKVGDNAINDEGQLLELLRQFDSLAGTGFNERDLERLITRVEQPIEMLQGLDPHADTYARDADRLEKRLTDNADLFHLPFGLTVDQRETVLEAIKVCRRENPDADGGAALALIAAHYLDRGDTP